jgi:ribosome-associated protein
VTKPLTTLAKKKLVVAALEDIKARDIQAIDVRKITSMFDWIVVASAESARQTKALARHVRDKLKEAGCAIVGTEGEEGAEWVLVDSGDIVAHIMQPAVRSYYNLEELWGEGKFDRPANRSAPLEKPLREEEDEPTLPHARPRPRKKAAATSKAAPKPRRRKPAA